jgi:SEC-C motif-containing protein
LAYKANPAKIGAQNTEKSEKMPSKPLAPNPQNNCPCGSGISLVNCCLPFINGERNPLTAEQLMRSRYTAHTLVAIDYLWATWAPLQRMRSSQADIRAWAEACEWLGLQIIATEDGGTGDNTALVEFIALYRHQGQLHQHHELARFSKVLGKWLYEDHQS